MPHEVYADPVMNDRPGFHSDIPVSELTECVTRAIEARDISSTPLVAETMDGVTHKTRPTPTEPNGARGLRPSDHDSGVQPTTQVAVRIDKGEHPDQKRRKSPHRLQSEQTWGKTQKFQ